MIKIACDLSEQSESHPETVRITQATWTLLIFFIINYVVKEMLKLAASPRSYFVQPESYLDIIIILMTTLIIWINLMPEVLYIRTVGLIFLFRSYNRFKERGLRTTFFFWGGAQLYLTIAPIWALPGLLGNYDRPTDHPTDRPLIGK